MYTYKIFRLIIIVFLITYFIGCFWWLLVSNINEKYNVDNEGVKNLNMNTFIQTNDLDELFVSPYNYTDVNHETKVARDIVLPLP
mmetsp:Transcript_11624/g.17621  ORF Transcript_11624/g.17621 Transcript_11624/m.17621 type:complete len:85 (-) Transcript_11624:1068-1322(-)